MVWIASCEVRRRTRPSGQQLELEFEVCKSARLVCAIGVVATREASAYGLPYWFAGLPRCCLLGRLGGKLDRGVEQDCAADTLRLPCGQLYQKPPTKRVTHPVRLSEIDRIESLKQV
jgi:hypothetical protein